MATAPRKSGAELIAERFPTAYELGNFLGPNFRLTLYAVSGRVVILQEFVDQRAGSWDAFVQATDSNEIEATMAAIERHLAGETEDPRAKELHDACTGVAHAFSSVRAEVDQALRERGDNETAQELDNAYTRWTLACEALLSGVRP